MKKVIGCFLALTASALVLTACGNKTAAKESASQTVEKSASQPSEESASGSATGDEMHHVKIHVKEYGTISVELDPEHAPITVDNFMELAKSGFYDGLTFHRIIEGFMIQGGDPLGTGQGGAEENIKGEFPNNGVKNPLSHTRGAISMARSMDNDSASSQFFIVHQDSPHLDGDYAAFGYVTDGMEVVDQICEKTQVEDDNGTVLKEHQPVIESVEVVD